MPAVTPGPGRGPSNAEAGPVVGSLCTGCGGLDLGVLTALGGGRIAWVADPDPHIAQILAARMPGVANLGDLRHIDWPAVEPVDVLVAGFPCQDISAAGKRAGIEKGGRSGLWVDIVAGLRLLRPALVVVENVAALRWRNGGLHRVLGDLAEAGYDAAWRSVRASDIGAAHRRERVFLLAWPRVPRPGRGDGDASRARRLVQRHHGRERTGWPDAAGRAPAAADPQGLGHRNGGPQGRAGIPSAAVAAGAPAGRAGGVAAHTTRHRRHERLPRATRLQGRPDAALGSHPAAHPDQGPGRKDHLVAAPDPTGGSAGEATVQPSSETVDWGVYQPAIHRWETVLGRPTPHPTQPGNHGRPVLAPAFVEHLMGLPPGWVTDLPLPRTAQLRALGNGVVPQQAAHAVSLLLDDLAELRHTDPRPPAGKEVLAA
ncbi:DNA cytosine methyltransferase [Saccharothrix xinjiangensis]|uniref:DNA (cytosine-5-)-methyltransferase n=1 Tax=Saccharothrix xinjiangensis TaxID=204798 RepID=A0ABV9YBX0_9PSEU